MTYTARHFWASAPHRSLSSCKAFRALRSDEWGLNMGRAKSQTSP